MYLQSTKNIGSGLWLAVTTCGGSVDIEVSAKNKKIYTLKDIGKKLKIITFIVIFISNSSSSKNRPPFQVVFCLKYAYIFLQKSYDCYDTTSFV